MKAFLLSLGLLMAAGTLAGQSRMRDYGIEYGIFRTGPLNAITDVKGVRVGHTTLIEGDSVRTASRPSFPIPAIFSGTSCRQPSASATVTAKWPVTRRSGNWETSKPRSC